MKVLGIDPGTQRTGYGLIEAHHDQLHLIACGVIAPSARPSRAEGLHHIHRELLRLIERYRPEEIAIEDPFVAKNVRSAFAIGEARAVAMLAAAAHRLPVRQYPPAKVKRVVAGYGAGSKEQVQQMVCLLLGLVESPQSYDATDALAVAICHVQERRLADLLAAAEG
ncbi:MAG: crossover junction endodeoxyribonuclease RuvC [Chloroflexi bacterium]|nr:crossover junction endodeoxyribonuclease RuvC [Chloroflexota bacterium]